MDELCKKLFKRIDILIIEDDEVALESLQNYLKRYFANVYAKDNGKSGLEAFHKYRPDIIVTDIYMPIIDGLNMVKSIKELERDIPVIVITSFSDEDILLEAIDIRVNKFIKKPFQVKPLINSLCEIAKEYYSDRVESISLEYGYRYDFKKRRLYLNSIEVKLSKKELALFDLLIKNRNQILSKELIEEYVWEGEIMTNDSLKALLRRVRKKIEPLNIETIPNEGYKFYQQPLLKSQRDYRRGLSVAQALELKG